MGSGKTSVGRRVAALTGAPFTDLDDLVVAAQGREVAEIFAADGEAAFRAAEAAALPAAIQAGGVLALGGGTPMDDAGWRLIKGRALSVFLAAPLDVLLVRIEAGAGRPLAARGHDEMARLLESRLPRYREADHTVDAARPPEDVAAEVAALWSA